MEDSYTVHRRRKAAARKREKTPDPPRREDESGEDEAGAREKIEKMVEETENMAECGVSKTAENISEKKIKNKKNSDVEEAPSKIPDKSEAASIIEPEIKTIKEITPTTEEPDKFRQLSDTSVVPRDSDVPNPSSKAKENNEKPIEDPKISVEKVLIDKFQKEPIALNKLVESVEPLAQKVSSQNGESSRAKKLRSKEKLQAEGRKNYGTDSSDTDEKMPPGFIRRRKSPDYQTTVSKIVTVSAAESRGKSNREKRHVSKQRYSTGSEEGQSQKKGDVKNGDKEERSVTSPEPKPRLREKRSVSRHRYPSDTDEEFVMKKSETYPQKSGPDKLTIKRSSSDIKKQIIPLRDDSLINDFAKAQEEYLRRERGILAPDNEDDYAPKIESKILRRRKLGVLHSDPEEMFNERKREAVKDGEKKKPWYTWLSYFRKKEKTDDPSPDEINRETRGVKKVTFMEFLRALREIVSEFKAYVDQNSRETRALKKIRNRCIGELILVIIYCGLGAFVFRFTEGAFETFYKCGVKRVKRDFLDHLWNYSHNMREEDWKSMARRKLMEFEEELHNAHEAGVHSYSGQKNWTFLNALSYCLTVITTIGYGQITPRTLAGRAITIVYAIFGIPIFLIILADFGKLFTRGIKFLWAFVRRLYYTGSCRKVRRTGPVQEVMKGVQLVYDFATFRRPSQMNPEDVEEMQRQHTVLNLDGNAPQPETPGTPAMSNFAIDDEFNLPISVAISILLGYIFVGATAYHMFEGWNFFESFYFVFISMSTIGFGDFVPKNPGFMMFSIVYLVFGLALTSMCINVVQTVLSDSFKQASQKISATIGFEVPPEGEEGDENVQVEESEEVGVADIQMTMKEGKVDEEVQEVIAPKAKQEDVEL